MYDEVFVVLVGEDVDCASWYVTNFFAKLTKHSVKKI